MLRGQRGNGFAGADRTHFLVRVEQHGDLRVVAPALVLQDLQRMQDDRNAALVVGNAGAVEPVALLADRLRRQRVFRIDRVHVGDQHDAALAVAGKRALDHGARALGDRHAFHLGAQRLQPLLGVAGHPGQALRVGAAGFDRHHLLERLHHRRLGRAGSGQQRGIWLGGSGQVAGAGKCQGGCGCNVSNGKRHGISSGWSCWGLVGAMPCGNAGVHGTTARC
ncbi:hypothetical protein D9M72_524610 [compost metagenome]